MSSVHYYSSACCKCKLPDGGLRASNIQCHDIICVSRLRSQGSRHAHGLGRCLLPSHMYNMLRRTSLACTCVWYHWCFVLPQRRTRLRSHRYRRLPCQLQRRSPYAWMDSWRSQAVSLQSVEGARATERRRWQRLSRHPPRRTRGNGRCWFQRR